MNEILPYQTGKALWILVPVLILLSCKKDPEVIPDNDAPYYDEIPTIVIENYVNRIFIDLIGREPLDSEMQAEVNKLKADSLSIGSRRSLIRKLQTNEDFIEGDSSLSHAYYQRMYDLGKVRLLEGASDYEIYEVMGIVQNILVKDSLRGDSVGTHIGRKKVNRLKDVLRSKVHYRQGTIGIEGMFARMLHNDVYDVINMNTFNFVNATFDDLFARFPTEEEFQNAFDIIEYNLSGKIFGQSAQNKQEYVDILTHSREFYEGMIRWAYTTLLARNPSTLEVDYHMETFYSDGNFQKVQENIMIMDEYANF